MELSVDREVTTNIQNSTAFSISTNSAKIFSLLSSVLYKNKERSVLTELTSNAIDAHKMIDKENVPIQVTLPTELAPEIRVRDFGPGLSEEHVIRFLTTYGESNKQQSNDFIGGFGIGSKSPAAITDAWSIHSHHDGKHSQYLIFVGGDGVPSLTKIIEKPTIETGLEIIVPVKSDKIRAWNNAALETFKFYPVKPILHNAKFVSYELKEHYVGENYTLYAGNNTKVISAIINHREYPIEIMKISEGWSAGPELITLLNMKNACLRFNTGELSISLSREDLQYDNRTITAIRNKLIAIFEELTVLWKNEVSSKSESELHYFILGSDVLNKYTTFGQYENTNRQTIYTALSKGAKHYSIGFGIGEHTISIKWQNDVNIKIMNKSGEFRRAGGASSSSIGPYHRPNKWAITKTYELSLFIKNIQDVIFVLNDASMINSRVVQAYAGKSAVVIADDWSILPDFLKKNLVKASDLTKPVIVREKREKIKSAIYRQNRNHFETCDESYFSAEAYVTYINFTNANSVSSILSDQMDDFNMCTELKIPIVFLKVGVDIPSFAKSPKEVYIKMYNDLKQNRLSIAKTSTIATIKYDRILKQFISSKNHRKTTNKSVWNDFIDIFDDGVKVIDEYEAKHTMIKIRKLEYVLKIQPNTTVTKYDDITKHMYETYPLLGIFEKFVNLTEPVTYSNIMKYIESCGV